MVSVQWIPTAVLLRGRDRESSRRQHASTRSRGEQRVLLIKYGHSCNGGGECFFFLVLVSPRLFVAVSLQIMFASVVTQLLCTYGYRCMATGVERHNFVVFLFYIVLHDNKLSVCSCA